jgi:hypothetical protein
VWFSRPAAAPGRLVEECNGVFGGEACVGGGQGLVGPQALTLCGLADGAQQKGGDGLR